MASKARAVPTRASTRTKSASSQPAPTTRTTRAAAARTNASPSTAPPPPPQKRQQAGSRSSTGTTPRRKARPALHKSSKAASIELPVDSDREPIKPSSDPYLHPLSHTSVRMSDPSSSSSIYTFSHVFPPDTIQSDFFRATTLPLVRDVLDGQNGLLFTYGVTNSGKTYTIQGGKGQGTAGILPRTLDVIFNSIEGLQGDGKYRPVRLQGIELADETAPPPQFATSSASPALADVLNDLPEDADTDPTVSSSTATTRHPTPTSSFLNMPLPSSQAHPLLLTRKALPLKPCPKSDTDADAGSAGKYVAGLRQLRVQSAADAKALLKVGQLHRRVFGTLANSQSSRSHAVVTIKVLRTGRLTLVDLAGSERTKHTQTSGERLREAGNINKSLMVLGQCMETLRANQRAVARSLAAPGARVDTREVKKGLAIVPFRHSKLTELLMDYFVGDGRAVMIVNVNPYDTGFDENAHVMRFAALAREVSTAPATSQPRVPPSPSKAKPSVPPGPHRRKVTISTGGHGRKASEAHLEVLEEDEEPGDGDEGHDDEPLDPLVDALFDEIERLHAQLFDAEVRCTLMEASTREEVMEEMEERMRSMEKMYKRRLMKEVEQNEKKMDAKIDLMQQAKQQSRPRRATKDDSDTCEPDSTQEESEEISTAVFSEPEADEDDSVENFNLTDISSDSQQQNKGKKKVSAIRAPQPDDYSSELLDTESEDEVGASYSQPARTHFSSQDDMEESSRTRKAGQSTARTKLYLDEAPSPIFEADVKAAQQAKFTRAATRDSTAVIPDKTARQRASNVEYVPEVGEVETVKKKKRQVGKSRAAEDTEVPTAGTSQGKAAQLRRSARN
ncbi:P-loop containing nucleoside triphosphate hydrolase protein [Amylocystis lapponica]|nr:P-loop containing nucleoside triphosphate hydrolase protein [Amylocystis lapponica]